MKNVSCILITERYYNYEKTEIIFGNANYHFGRFMFCFYGYSFVSCSYTGFE